MNVVDKVKQQGTLIVDQDNQEPRTYFEFMVTKSINAFHGLGLLLNGHTGAIYEVVPDSFASTNGVEKGNEIVEIDGIAFGNLDIEDREIYLTAGTFCLFLFANKWSVILL